MLYWSWLRKSCPGLMSSVRTSIPNMPARKNALSTLTRYMTPIRL